MHIDWKSVFDWAALIAYAFAAAFWIVSAKVRLTPIKPGLDELDKVTALSAELKTMSTWNAWAAATTAVAVALQIAARIAPAG